MPFIIRNKNNTPYKLNVKNAEIHVSVNIGSFILKSTKLDMVYHDTQATLDNLGVRYLSSLEF